MARTDVQFKLRLPQSHKLWVERKSKDGFHSMQAVISKLIAEAMRQDALIKKQ